MGNPTFPDFYKLATNQLLLRILSSLKQGHTHVTTIGTVSNYQNNNNNNFFMCTKLVLWNRIIGIIWIENYNYLSENGKHAILQIGLWLFHTWRNIVINSDGPTCY